MIPAKISSRNELFQNEFIPIVVPGGIFRSETFHKYHLEEVRTYSGTELATWIGWAD